VFAFAVAVVAVERARECAGTRSTLFHFFGHPRHNSPRCDAVDDRARAPERENASTNRV
jgi:hypothetical protein